MNGNSISSSQILREELSASLDNLEVPQIDESLISQYKNLITEVSNSAYLKTNANLETEEELPERNHPNTLLVKQLESNHSKKSSGFETMTFNPQKNNYVSVTKIQSAKQHSKPPVQKLDQKIGVQSVRNRFATRSSKEGTITSSQEQSHKATHNSPFSMKNRTRLKEPVKEQKLKIKKKDNSMIQTSRSSNKLKLKLKKPKNMQLLSDNKKA